jgi:hypothetical protein
MEVLPQFIGFIDGTFRFLSSAINGTFRFLPFHACLSNSS